MIKDINSPRRLRRGDKLAVVAPSSPFVGEELVESAKIAREFGLELVMGQTVKNLRTTETHTGTLRDRVDELMWAFTDPTISGVLVATGGYGSSQLLSHLDYDAIAKSKRVLVGMSDVTSLHNAILARSSLVGVCGQSPNVRVEREFHDSDAESFALVLELIMSQKKWLSRPFDVNMKLPRTVCPGRATGHVVGGNLDTFAHLVGTPYFPDCDGAILFIEDVHKGGMSVSRDLTQLTLAGVFDVVSGVVIGEFYDTPPRESERDPAIESVIVEHFKDLGAPCSFGYSFSHGSNTVPIPIGAMCTMDATSGRVSFDFAMRD